MIHEFPRHQDGRERGYRGQRGSDQQSENGLVQHNRLVPCITKAALATLGKVHRAIKDSEVFAPEAAFETVKVGKREKIALGVDLFAEQLATIELGRRLKQFQPLILGEESLRDEGLDLTNESRIVALLDMVDGTDLFERGMGNWCSAAAFFLPAQRQILGAFVCVPEGAVFYWTIDTRFPMKFDLKTGTKTPVTGPSSVRAVAEASVSFYGQKVHNFCSCASPLAHARNHRLQAKGLGLRIYNLAGIPAMMKVVDCDSHRRLDAVFELVGQHPHDVVPGAIITQAGGATILGLDGAPLDLISALLRPANSGHRLKYVLAATPELAAELLMCLRDEGESDTADVGGIAA